MKKIFFVLVTVMLLQDVSAQDKATTTHILNGYYAVKDALVSGNATLANSMASELLESVTEGTNLPEASRLTLIKEATNFTKSKDLKKQREHFSSLSESMFVLAKATKLDGKPIYKAYCPMVKASWLSSSASIRNPYYGSSMLACGSVVETLK